MDILHGIEAKALALRDAQPAGTVMEIDDTAAAIGTHRKKRETECRSLG